jgi:Flp pilus assembly protein TadD
MKHAVKRWTLGGLGSALVAGALSGLAGCAAVPVKDTPRSLQPSQLEALRLRMAESLVQQRDYELALPYIRDLLPRHPRNPRLHLLLGIVLREKGIRGPAEQELRRALALDGNSSAAHAALASLLARSRRLAEAERHLRRAISLEPGHAPHHNDLGVCLLMQRRHGDARRALQQAIHLDPGLRVAYNNLGFVHAMEGDDEGMERAFSQAGGRAMALTNLGLVEELRGHPAAARRRYEEALRLQRGYPPALHNLRTLEPEAAGPRPAEADDSAAGFERLEETAP